jgi:hypothetical protein
MTVFKISFFFVEGRFGFPTLDSRMSCEFNVIVIRGIQHFPLLEKHGSEVD